MKLLVSAYDCAPAGASESIVAWNWIQAFIRCGHYVHVLTRSSNRAAIEDAFLSVAPELTFHYYDPNGWPAMFEGSALHYLHWQWGAYRLAKWMHRIERFHRVHHVPVASYRRPSFMGRLGIPFVFGPVGGGETAPAALRAKVPFGARCAEALRNVAAMNPLTRQTMARAQVIACATADTMAHIPRSFRSKCLVQHPAGLHECDVAVIPPYSIDPPHFLIFASLRRGSGLQLALEALAEARVRVPEARLRVISEGKDRPWFVRQARAAGVEHAVDWLTAAPQSELARVYENSVALLSPSYRDSSGLKVLHAMAAGRPIICLDCGGPGAITTTDCACVVKTEGSTERALVHAIAEAMILLATNPMLRARMSANALARARQLTWDRAVRAVCDSVELLDRAG